ncbi:MAG: hypothetical protein JWL84_1928 [Rhodospirillales bacterium]|nr:hypothetical protein [Rhodospirillales bacterium]
MISFDRHFGERHLLALSVLASFAVSWCAIDERSLWIDEFVTWSIAQAPNPGSWWSGFIGRSDSDGQMPVFHLYMYLWTSVFGSSERVMRLANAPCFAIGCAAIAASPVSFRLRLAWLAVIYCHPYIWYYLNETRPYILLFAGSALLSVSTINLFKSLKQKRQIAITQITITRADVLMYSGGSVLMLGASILGAFWIASTAIVIGATLNHKMRDRVGIIIFANWLPVVFCALVSSVILAISVHSFWSGARASTVGGFSFGSIGYGILELFGTAGWGPGRNDLRTTVGEGINGHLYVFLIFGAIGCAFIVSALRRLETKVAFAVVTASCAPLVVISLAGYFLHWRVVGRHISPILIPVSFAYASEIVRLFSYGYLWRLAAVALAVGLGTSTAMICLSPRHYKDDYADAAAFVRPLLASSKIVVWAANAEGAAYYRLIQRQKSEHPDQPLWLVEDSTSNKLLYGFPLDDCPGKLRCIPDLIVYSKPDIYDPQNRIWQYIEATKMTRVASYPGFRIYAR